MLVTVWEADTQRTEEFFQYAGYRARDMHEPLRESAKDLLDQTKAAFDTEGESLWGVRWEEVSVAWRKRKQKKGGTAEMLLRFNDNLIDAATGRGGLPNPIHVTATRMDYVLRFPVYAAVHQFGWWDKNIPARPYVAITEELELATTQHFLWWLEDIKAQNRLRSRITTSPILDNPASGGVGGFAF